MTLWGSIGGVIGGWIPGGKGILSAAAGELAGGRVHTLAYNIVSGQDWGQDLLNPTDMLIDVVSGAGGAATRNWMEERGSRRTSQARAAMARNADDTFSTTRLGVGDDFARYGDAATSTGDALIPARGTIFDKNAPISARGTIFDANAPIPVRKGSIFDLRTRQMVDVQASAPGIAEQLEYFGLFFNRERIAIHRVYLQIFLIAQLPNL